MLDKKKLRKKAGTYVIGSVIVAIGAVIVMPKIINYLSEKVFDEHDLINENDDWGPKIVRKEENKGE